MRQTCCNHVYKEVYGVALVMGLSYFYDGRMDHHHYIYTLENTLLPTRDIFWRETNDWIFQQDNAPCHTAKSVKA